MPAISLPKECAYGSAVAIGERLFYVGGGNGIDWFSSMLRLSLNEEGAQWEQVRDLIDARIMLVFMTATCDITRGIVL